MALGNNSYGNNNNNSGKNYSPTVYSGYKFNNGESQIDATALAGSFWNGLLKLSISPRKQGNGTDGVINFDYDNAIAIYLNHTKARILHGEITKFLSDPITFNNSGLTSGQGLVLISNGAEFGMEGSPCLVIRKIGADGLTESSYAYQFKRDYHYAVRNYDEVNNTQTKEIDDYADIEIYQLLTLLQSYFESMTNAVAYTVLEQSKYNDSRISTKLDTMAAKLGVSFGGKNNGGQSRPSAAEGIFNRKSSGGSSNTTVDDINSQLGY